MAYLSALGVTAQFSNRWSTIPTTGIVTANGGPYNFAVPTYRDVFSPGHTYVAGDILIERRIFDYTSRVISATSTTFRVVEFTNVWAFVIPYGDAIIGSPVFSGSTQFYLASAMYVQANYNLFANIENIVGFNGTVVAGSVTPYSPAYASPGVDYSVFTRLKGTVTHGGATALPSGALTIRIRNGATVVWSVDLPAIPAMSGLYPNTVGFDLDGGAFPTGGSLWIEAVANTSFVTGPYGLNFGTPVALRPASDPACVIPGERLRDLDNAGAPLFGTESWSHPVIGTTPATVFTVGYLFTPLGSPTPYTGPPGTFHIARLVPETLAVSGTISANATIAATRLGRFSKVSGTIAAHAALAGAAIRAVRLRGTIAATSHLTGAASSIMQVKGTIAARSTLHGAFGSIIMVGGAIHASSTMHGQPLRLIQERGSTIAAQSVIANANLAYIRNSQYPPDGSIGRFEPPAERMILDKLVGLPDSPSPGSLYLGLLTSTDPPIDVQWLGRYPVSFNSPNGGTIASNTAVALPVIQDAKILGIGVYTQSGDRLCVTYTSGRSFAAGDVISVPAGRIRISLD